MAKSKKPRKLTKAVLTATEKEDGSFNMSLAFIPKADANGKHAAGQMLLAMMDDFMKKHGDR